MDSISKNILHADGRKGLTLYNNSMRIKFGKNKSTMIFEDKRKKEKYHEDYLEEYEEYEES